MRSTGTETSNNHRWSLWLNRFRFCNIFLLVAFRITTIGWITSLQSIKVSWLVDFRQTTIGWITSTRRIRVISMIIWEHGGSSLRITQDSRDVECMLVVMYPTLISSIIFDWVYKNMAFQRGIDRTSLTL